MSAPAGSLAHLNAMLLADPKTDAAILGLIERVLSAHKEDKDIQTVCFLLAGAIGTVRKLGRALS